MGDEHGYWEWRDQLLAHPEGRATGGGPCVKCPNTVPPNAHWKHRDRHVCGPRCNRLLARQFSRTLASAAPLRIDRPEPLADPRTDPTPRVFRHDAASGEPFPFEFHGFGPRHGDVVERYGVCTGYQWLRSDNPAQVPPYASHGFHVASHESGHHFVYAATELGSPGDTIHGDFDADAVRRETCSPFRYRGMDLVWCREHIRDLTADGQEYTWRAAVCVPAQVEHGPALWSPAYRRRSEQRARINASTAAHARRVRLDAATIERFDPLEIFERDEWICQLCDEPVDRALKHPDPLGASLDHVLPLAAGGGHSRANTQLAHWICNVRKGARTPGR
ncbi:HNH endonuclease [Aquihabitans sp. G128]|uniref:HNH endonuclease n=1 Tax=Aquihabitans sp. G128 TaxID=2849779 RepID=UPI001C215A51|nr:HNH endonuclease [Aquihabitans sp. G128]QXC61616.1 HNH endonuclease [Aquihabitans sp. G128]